MNGILLHDARQYPKQATALASPLFLPERIFARTHFCQNPRFTGVVSQLGGSPIAGNEVVPERLTCLGKEAGSTASSDCTEENDQDDPLIDIHMKRSCSCNIDGVLGTWLPPTISPSTT